MTSTRRAELQQTGELQSGELRKNLLINLGFLRRFCFVIHPPQKKSNIEVSPFQDQLPFKTRALLAPATI